MIPHDERTAIRARLHAITSAHTFDHRGICTDLGKYEGCYEATVYFADLSLEGEEGEGLICLTDTEWQCAFKVTDLERAMLAGPWDVEGNILRDPDVLYVIVSDENGGIRGSHCAPSEWEAAMTEAA